MFGRKKMYKKGLADAMKAYEAFGKKQEAALEKIVQDFKNSNKELDAKLKALGEDIIAVYDYLDKSEKAALYKLCTPMDLKELEEPERRLLIAVLCQLADDEGSRYNSDQRKFVNAIRRYLEIPNPQTFADYSAIEEIDSLDIQETIMRVCLEFMYLQDADEMSDDQEAFFDNFAVSKRQAKLIEFDVIRQFHMFGAEGVAEKYGRIDEVVESLEEKEDTNEEKTVNKNNKECEFDDNCKKSNNIIPDFSKCSNMKEIMDRVWEAQQNGYRGILKNPLYNKPFIPIDTFPENGSINAVAKTNQLYEYIISSNIGVSTCSRSIAEIHSRRTGDPMPTVNIHYGETNFDDATPSNVEKHLNLSFLMVVHHVTHKIGRGTIVIGEIIRGHLNVNEVVGILTKDELKTTVAPALWFHEARANPVIANSVERGDKAQILLRGIEKNEVQRGDCIIKACGDAETAWLKQNESRVLLNTIVQQSLSNRIELGETVPLIGTAVSAAVISAIEECMSKYDPKQKK